MNRQYGSWQEAKIILDNYFEPVVAWNKEGISKSMPDILGYQVIYTKRLSNKKCFKSFVTIMNPNSNSCYIKNFTFAEKEDSTF